MTQKEQRAAETLIKIKKIDEMKEKYLAELNKEKARLVKQIGKEHPWLGHACWFANYEEEIENKNARIGILTGFDPQRLIEGRCAFQCNNLLVYKYCLPVKEDDFKIYKE